jgi:TonB family protein
MTILLLVLALFQQSDVYRVGEAGVTAPTIISKVEPNYTEEARKANIQGTVTLETIIDEKGVPKVVRILRSLGYGLDESAVTAFEQWRFSPATKDDQAVKVQLKVEMNFNIGQKRPGPR